jgi:hypothetical protein
VTIRYNVLLCSYLPSVVILTTFSSNLFTYLFNHALIYSFIFVFHFIAMYFILLAPYYSFLLCIILLHPISIHLFPFLYSPLREGVATRELARLYRDNGAVDKAAECYYHHLLLTGGGALVTAVQKVILGVCVCI